MYQLSWALYIVGFGIVIASWVNLVSSGIGWIGWIIGMAGFILGQVIHRRNPDVAKELERLSQLKDSGQITEQEYAEAKLRLLS